ncbi:TNT domain-containing protein [Saccharothrix sp. AJ9571]|nr:TNT domain-containing protein [Saccharothrix sp. AJ9571]
MRWIKSLAATLALFSAVLVVPPTASASTEGHLTECSADFFHDDKRLGPERLPKLGVVGWQLLGYHRTGHQPVDRFLDEYYDEAAGSWRYPPADGYVIGPDGQPDREVGELEPGERIDRYGSEYGGFLAPKGSHYGARAIPPSNLVGTPAELCNYRAYRVLREFDVYEGPVAPWFAQPGGGQQFQLNGSLVPGAPAQLNVLWLVDNGYLARL